MAEQNKIAGIMYLKIDGELQRCVGEFTYNLGYPKRDALAGSDSVHGYSETIQTPHCEGELRDHKDLDVAALVQVDNATVTLELANGKVIVYRDAWYAGEGSIKTSDAAIGCRFESRFHGEEIK